MIFNKKGLAFPDYQNKTSNMFNKTHTHDVKQWEYCKQRIKHFRTCIEFGAHIGTSALQYSPHFKRVISFEPLPDLFECLQYNTKDLNNVEIHNLAIGEKAGTAELYINPRNPGSNVIGSEETQSVIDSRWGNKLRLDFQKKKEPIIVETRSIDSYNFDEVDFIKIDTEGYNIEPLQGMKDTLQRCSPLIMLEQLRTKKGTAKKISKTACDEFLSELGYKLIKTITIDDIYMRTK